MKINQVKTYADVGMFLMEAQVYIDVDANVDMAMRKIMSRPISEKGLEQLLRVCEDLRGTQSAPHTIFAIRAMNNGQVIARQFLEAFDDNWPPLGSLRDYKIFLVTEKGLNEVEVTL